MRRADRRQALLVRQIRAARGACAMKAKSTLTHDDLEMFYGFHISGELLEAAQVERVTDQRAREEFGINGNGDNQGIVFPYYVPLLKNRVTARLRRDHPDIENG